MAAPQSPRDILAEVMDQSRKALVPHLAEMLKRSKIKEVDSSEERTRFWQRALTPEQEQELWRQELVKAGTLDTSALSPQQLLGIGITISQQVYPDRWDMATGEGRDTQSAQAEWAWKQAMKGPPEGAGDGEQANPDAAPGPRPDDQPNIQAQAASGPGAGAAGQEQYGAVVPQDLGQPAGVQAPTGS
jgi:hypothetical protein